MIKDKIASILLGLVCFVGFIPLLAASWLSGRDYQVELAEQTVELWKKGRWK